MCLRVEVLTTSRQARVAVRHVRERGQGLRRAPYACGAGHQRSNALDVHLPRRPLCEVLAKRIVEPVDGRGCKLPPVV